MALYRINRGPDFGQTVHLPQSQEIALACRFGDLVPVEDPDLKRAIGNIVHYPSKGHKIINCDATCVEQKLAICFDDGMGGRMIYLDKYGRPCVPGPTKKWVYNPETGAEGYEMVPSDCPQSIIDEFLRLGGGSTEDDGARQARIDRLQREKFEREAQQKRQDNLQAGIINAGMATR